MDVREKLDKLLGKWLGHLSLAAANDLIANGVTIQKWISVKDRLPEKGGSYLVFSSKSKTVFTAHYWLGDRWANRANGQFITHWMPLPQPPTTCHMTREQQPEGE